MKAKIIERDASGITIQMRIPFSKEMLTTEEAIQECVNQAGLLATEYALLQHDTDGLPITVGNKKFTSKGQVSKTYQCPFGEFEFCRHVYQSNEGGSTYCPLDKNARIVICTTPKFAKMVSSKYSQMGSTQVQRDLRDNHSRLVSRNYIQKISEGVGDIAESKEKWEYSAPVQSEEVSTIGISLDGTCMLMSDDGWRQAMVGSISYYDAEGERLHTGYVANSPEYGKETFYKMFATEINRAVKKFPEQTYVGVADGAADNWTFLEPFVAHQVLDFYHASEYLSQVSKAAFKNENDATKWLHEACQTLKHIEGGATLLLKNMEEFLKKRITDAKKKIISQSITYFKNHIHMMNYPKYINENMPIGSGVIEAACKVIIKQRMCNSGMKWSDNGAKTVLILRCFNETDGKWNQFWNKINKQGF